MEMVKTIDIVHTYRVGVMSMGRADNNLFQGVTNLAKIPKMLLNKTHAERRRLEKV